MDQPFCDFQHAAVFVPSTAKDDGNSDNGEPDPVFDGGSMHEKSQKPVLDRKLWGTPGADAAGLLDRGDGLAGECHGVCEEGWHQSEEGRIRGRVSAATGS